MPKFIPVTPLYVHLCPYCGADLDYAHGHLDVAFLRHHLPNCINRPEARWCERCYREFLPATPATRRCRTCRPVWSGVGRFRTCLKCERRFRGVFPYCGRCWGTCWLCKKGKAGQKRLHRRHRLRKSKCLWHCSQQECRDIWKVANTATSVGGNWGQIRGVESWCAICGARCGSSGPSICRNCIEDVIISGHRLGKSSISVSDWLESLDRVPFSLYDTVYDPADAGELITKLESLERFCGLLPGERRDDTRALSDQDRVLTATVTD